MSVPRILIRPATVADVPAILGFIRALARYEKLSDACIATQDMLRDHLFFGTFSTFLARPGIYLEDLFVLPEARGCGVGKALLSAVAGLAVQRNCGRLEWAVLDWNDPAIGFYKKVGATPLDEWTTYRVTGDTLRQLAVGK